MKRLAFALLALVGLGQFLIGCSSQTSDQVGSEMKSETNKLSTEGSSDIESGKVKQALDSASGLEAKNIKVDTDSNAKSITLSGTVSTPQQKKQALGLAKGIAGTEFTVSDKIAVDPGGTK